MARKRDEAAFEAKKSKILRAAEALFVEHGFHQTGMASICEAVGMSPGALYRYFPSKTAIIKAIVEEERAGTMALLNHLADASDFRKTVAAVLIETIIAVSDETYARLALEIAAEGARNPEIAAIIAVAEREAHERLSGLIAAAQDRGQVDPDVDSAVAATILFMLIDGAVTLSASTSRVPGARLRRDLERVVDGVLGTGARDATPPSPLEEEGRGGG